MSLVSSQVVSLVFSLVVAKGCNTEFVAYVNLLLFRIPNWSLGLNSSEILQFKV